MKNFNWSFIGKMLSKIGLTIEHMILGFLAGIVFVVGVIVKWLFC